MRLLKRLHRHALPMKIYLTDSQIPELRDIPPKLARAVLLVGVKLMRSDARLLTELPILLCAVGCPLGSCVAGWAVCAFGLAQPRGGDQMTACLLGLGVGGLLGGFIGRQIQIPTLRRYLRRAIDELTFQFR